MFCLGFLDPGTHKGRPRESGGGEGDKGGSRGGDQRRQSLDKFFSLKDDPDGPYSMTIPPQLIQHILTRGTCVLVCGRLMDGLKEKRIDITWYSTGYSTG